jgi:hypothetical protein
MPEIRDEEGRISKDLLAAYEAPEPAGDLEARLFARLRAELPRDVRRWPYLLAAALAAVLAAVSLYLRPAPLDPREGSIEASARTPVLIGERGVAIAEPGTVLRWSVGEDGAARLEQPEGIVFYHVGPGGPFVVETPAGEISVRGTSFRVEVSGMKPSKDTAAGGAVGAALTAVVFLTVYEGKVLFANEQGSLELAAGDQASATAGEAPTQASSTDEGGKGATGGMASAAAAKPPGSCAAALSSCQDQLAVVQADLEKFLPMEERFARSEPAPELEARLTPSMEKWLLTEKGGQPLTYNAECRGRVCSLEIFLKKGESFSYAMSAIQSEWELRPWINRMRFGGGGPTNDALTGEPIEREEVFFEVGDLDATQGMVLVEELIGAWKASDVGRRCYDQYKVAGELEAVVKLDPEESREFGIELGGSLGTHPEGKCLADRLRAMASAFALPEKFIGALVHARFVMPPE